ncbi:MAG: haloacid dehalogenase type II [Pseudomonadota bacterium]
MHGIKALLFDTFGTVVDWRGSIARLGMREAQRKGISNVDWDAFARSWRAGYQPGMEKVRSGQRGWTPIDVIHRERLQEILPEFGLAEHFDASERDRINLWWHQLDPWPDAVPGLRRLAKKYPIGPLSNGSTVLLVNMAKRAAIPWDYIASSDVTRAYKPEPAAYLNACAGLGLNPGCVMMCAAHNDDLEAASQHGMRTAYIDRPYEYGPDQKKDFGPTGDWDVITDHIGGIAEALGC